MKSKKPWYKSKAIWGGIIAFIIVLLEMYGLVNGHLYKIATALAIAFGVYGRIVAEKKIGR